MGDDYITLKFSVAAPINFRLGDWCDADGFGRFEIVEPQKPEYNAETGGYDYELKLEAQYRKWRNKIAKYLPNVGGSECSWTLTATALVHMQQVLANVMALASASSAYLYNGTTEWVVAVGADVDGSAKTISYDSTNIIDALSSIAEAFSCEWWVDNNRICLGKCDIGGDYTDFRQNDNVSEMSRSDSSEDYATRIIPFGSERNISPRYRKDLIFTVTECNSAGGYYRINDTTRLLRPDWFDPSMIDYPFADTTIPRVFGIIIETIDEQGNTLETISHVVWNNAGETDPIKRNVLSLPSGYTASVGDRFKITNIMEYKVKSSYFTDRTVAYSGSSDYIKNGVVTKRLMLPEPFTHIDVRADLTLSECVEDVVIFEDVYPEVICTVTAVSTVDRKEEVENDDGSVTTRSFAAYCLNDDVFTSARPFSEKYIIEGETLQAVFRDGKRYKEGDEIPEGKSVGDLVNENSGKLNGWTFEMAFTKDESGATLWEIVRDNNAYVPNEFIRPEVGDQFALIGVDISIIDDVYIDKAEEELLNRANLYVEKLNTDASTYDCTMMPDSVKDEAIYGLGKRINLINEAYFTTTTDSDGREWGRKSRIIGFELALDIPYDNPVYTVGEKAAYSRLGEISDNIDSLNYAMSGGTTTSGGKGSRSVYIITSNDPTPASDTNVFSAVRSLAEFVGAKTKQVINHLWTFAKGINIGNFLIGETGAAIDSDGNAELESAVVRGALNAGSASIVGNADVGERLKTKTASISESMGSDDYVPGFTGKGWNMRMSGGLSYLDLDNLTLRGSMTVYELLIKQIRATNGGIVGSAANARVKKVDGTDSIAHLPGDTVKVWYEQGNPFKAGDFVQCMKWDTAHNRMHQYWAKVKAIGTDATYGDYTEFDYSSFDTYKGGSGPAAIERLDIPRVGDEAVLFGSTVSGRQGVIYITAAEDEPPCIEVLEGVTTNSIEGVQRTRLGSLKQMSDSDFDGLLGGSGLYSDNAYLKGRFFLSSKGEEVDAFVSRVSNEQATQTNLIVGAGDLSTCKAYGTRTVLAVSYDTTEAAMCVEKQTSSTTASYNFAMMFSDAKTPFAELGNVANGTDLTFSIYIKGDGTMLTPPKLRFSSKTISTEGSLTTDWKRFEYHFASTWNIGTVYAFILNFVGAEVGGKCWLKMPQMERGTIATAWSDFAKSSSLIKQTADSIVAKVNDTGIDIENKTITLTADKTYIKAPDGTVIAAFTDGKLQRAFLDLGNLDLTSDAVPTIDNFEWTAGYDTNGTLTDVETKDSEGNDILVVAADILEDFTVEIGTKYMASGLSNGDLVAVNAGITFNPSNTTTVKNVVITATVNGEAVDYDDANEQVLFTYKDGTSTYDIQVSITFTLQGKRYSYAGDTIIATPQTEYNAFIRGWNGTANNIKVYHNPSVAAYNNRTIIGSNGMVSYWGGRYIFHQSVPTGEGDTSESGVTIIAGRNGWKITDNGILISNNGGLDWHTA